MVDFNLHSLRSLPHACTHTRTQVRSEYIRKREILCAGLRSAGLRPTVCCWVLSWRWRCCFALFWCVLVCLLCVLKCGCGCVFCCFVLLLFVLKKSWLSWVDWFWWCLFCVVLCRVALFVYFCVVLCCVVLGLVFFFFFFFFLRRCLRVHFS
jgi:hypothetical protein